MAESKPRERTVSSAEFQNNVGRYIDKAGSEPVVITRYRHPSRVLLDFDEYRRLQELARSRPTRRAVKVEDLEPELVAALQTADYSHIEPELDRLME